MSQPTPALQKLTDVDDTLLYTSLRRIIFGKGWAVHSIIFEFCNGTRRGLNLSNSGRELSLTDPAALRERANSRTVDIAYGDYIVQIRGHYIRATTPYIVHSITFEMKSGQNISVESNYETWKGDEFTVNIPEMTLVVDVNDLGRRNGIHPDPSINVVQSSLFQLISIQSVGFLPPRVRTILRQQFDIMLNVNEGMNEDVCWRIFSFFRGCDFLRPEMV
mmetsp:Transcript_4118/g.4673  ORF Transcript_4118/g.4673 Transcript_4118/m.4673 type:complete len:219 (-) Transcript_4118:1450-2106(-)